MIGLLWGVGVVVEIAAFYTQSRWIHRFSISQWLMLFVLVWFFEWDSPLIAAIGWWFCFWLKPYTVLRLLFNTR
jgi:hypothetical protein